jgi:hypothetical protein
VAGREQEQLLVGVRVTRVTPCLFVTLIREASKAHDGLQKEQINKKQATLPPFPCILGFPVNKVVVSLLSQSLGESVT